MTVKVSDFAAYMRGCGIRRIAFGQMQPLDFVDGEKVWTRGVVEIELEPASPDTIPAPEMHEPEPVEDKPATECSHAGCHEPKGFSFAPQYCERHGLKALGVST